MPMLAEPRRKVRYNINPNGNMWASDSDAFGRKMLEKMGWSSGKGLGANLDGMTSHIKVHYKCDPGGVGFKDRNDQWTDHEDNFSQLLKNLQEHGHHVVKADRHDNMETKSLELKSKASKARVHYQKFTRGKDLSRYSSKDLANIFGRKTLERNVKEPSDEEVIPEESNVNDDQNSWKVKSFGIETLQGGSMTDYFKKKMSQFKTSLTLKVNNNDDCGDDEEKPSFGLGFPRSESPEPDQHVGFGFLTASGTNTINADKPKRRKRKSIEDGEEDRVVSTKKSKKNAVGDGGLSNEAFDAQDVQDTNDSITLTDNPYEVKPKKLKKNKKDKSVEETVADNTENCADAQLNIKSKKKKLKVGVENLSFVAAAENTEEGNTVDDNLYEVVPNEKRSKKKKKKRNDYNGLENPTFDDSNGNINEPDQEETSVIFYEVVVKDKKKRRKKFVEVENEPDINLGITDDLILNVSNFDPKPILQTPQSADSRLRRRKSVRIDESLNQERIIPNILQQKQLELSGLNDFDIDISMQNRGVANEAFDIKSTDNGFYEKGLECDSVAGHTLLKKKKQKKANIGIANPGFRNVQEEVEDVHRSLEIYQAEVENDINEVKQQQSETDVSVGGTFIGTVSMLTDHQVSSEGNLLLAYKHSNLTPIVNWYENKTTNKARTGYKHLVKGDVEVEFKGTNMHEIIGYATPEALAKKKKKASDVTELNVQATVVVPIPKNHLTDLNVVEILTNKEIRRQLKRRKNRFKRDLIESKEQ